jgi:hypothetical protein
VLATPAIMRLPPPPLAGQAVLLLRRLAAMQQDALDAARTWGAGAASRYAFAARLEPHEEPRGELVQVVGNASTVAPTATSQSPIRSAA